MKLHELKIKYKYWLEVNCDNKPFELRKNDRDYQVDDLINFTVVDLPIGKGVKVKSFSTTTVYQITYVLKNCPEYGLDKDYCILGIRELVIKK